MDVKDFEVGWVCALSTEFVAACELLDEEYPISDAFLKNDNNVYVCGRIGVHRVVISCLPKGNYGIASAASVASDMMRSFPSIRFGLMVGIGGGAPGEKNDIRLGDVVVACPSLTSGGIINIQYGKNIQGQDFQYTGSLASPPRILLSALNKLVAQHERKGHNIKDTISSILANPRLKSSYSNPGRQHDHLFHSKFLHPEAEEDCQVCCLGRRNVLIKRKFRPLNTDDPVIHYGVIASSDNLMKNAEERDLLAKKHNVLCFEMEAAGLMNHFPCLVIRGICDYSDTHKNKKWQGYAAAVAAAYAKELLNIIPPATPAQSHAPTTSRQYHGLFAFHTSQSSCQVDLVVVHGLGGDAVSTWKAPDGYSWLRDWLPKQFDGTILTFGYDSALTWTGSDIPIRQTATNLLNLLQLKRPGRNFVLLGHGLGGIIVRVALGLTMTMSDYTYLKAQILGLIFLGTPQGNLHVHEWWRVIYRMSNSLLLGKSYRLAVMERAEQISTAIRDLFQNLPFGVEHLPVLSFYETLPMPDAGSVVVDPEAVIIASAREQIFPLRADHLAMIAPSCRVLEYHNNPYVSVAEMLTQLSASEPASRNKPSVLEKLYSIDYELYSVSVPDAFPQTGIWLWKHDSFKLWVESPSSGMFWMKAPPGYGKTVIAKGLARDLKTQRNLHPGLQPLRRCIVLVYFFREEMIESTSLTSFVRSILHQILLQNPQLEIVMRKTIEDFVSSTSTSSNLDPYSMPEKLWRTLQSILHHKQLPNVLMVIDGLDEAKALDIQNICVGLIELLHADQTQNSLKIFLTSRDDHLISSIFSSNDLVQAFDVTPEHTSKDIDIFLESTIAQFAEEHTVPSKTTAELKSVISSRADGMFLWATLAWDHFHKGVAIWSQSVVRARLEALEDLPSGLSYLYLNLIQKIDKTVLQGLHAVFMIIIAVARPISCEELEQILGMRDWVLRTSDMDIPFSIRATINIHCANLLNVSPTGIVRFVHLSLKEFLRASVLKQEVNVLHTFIASKSIQYLTLFDIREEAKRDVMRSPKESCLMKRFPFYRYAATFLRYHMNKVKADDHLWLQYASMTKDYAAFHVAASPTHRSHVNVCDLRSPCYHLPTPLRHAIRVHDDLLIQSFAHQGYNLDEKLYDIFSGSVFSFNTAVHANVKKTNIITKLINCGASPNIRDYRGRTSLHESILLGCHETTRFLLSCGNIDVNTQDEEGRTPLHYEATSGRGSLLLNDPRVNVDLRDKGGRTPVTTAAFWGDHHTTIAFLRSARNALAQHEGELSILIATAQQGWLDITSNILDKLPNVSDHRGYDGRTILHWAVLNDWENVLERAVQAHARINDVDKRKRTPLHEAAELGNSRLAKKLIALGASARYRDQQGRTAIQLAAIEGFSDTVLVLMESDFDINDADDQQRTLVHWAASWDWCSVMWRVLEQQRADLLKHDHMGRTALHIAALCGCPNVLRLLKNKGVFDVNETVAAGNTLLHLAARAQSKSTVGIVLAFDEFIRKRALNQHDQTALDVAMAYDTSVSAGEDGGSGLTDLLRSEGVRISKRQAENTRKYYLNSERPEPYYHQDWKLSGPVPREQEPQYLRNSPHSTL